MRHGQKNRRVAVLVFALAMLLSSFPLAAQLDRTEEKQRIEQKSTKKDSAKDRKAAARSVFARCREASRGLKGPARGRFMTNCLKERRPD